jgi:hypothetical protein
MYFIFSLSLKGRIHPSIHPSNIYLLSPFCVLELSSTVLIYSLPS